MDTYAYERWGFTYGLSISGRFDYRGHYQSFTPAQQERQLARLTEWWAA